MKITPQNHPWELIFQRDGRVLAELLPAFQQAVDRFKAQSCSRILDLGCGCGRHLVGFSQEGFQATGMDISATGLTLTRSWLKEEKLDAGLVQGDFRQGLPFQGAHFQGIFSTQVIHHALVKEIRLVIQEIWRVLEPDGLVFVTVAGRKAPPHLEIEPGTFIPQDGDEKGLPHHIFSPQELREEFSRFEVLETDYRDEGRVLILWARKPTA